MTSEMDVSDQVYGRTFRVNFSTEGAAKLRERVNEKLKEFMGDYTDDTLVEYVIVLLRNGRHKEEARNELNVFLGDDTDSFVSWLWDHLTSNLHLYVQQRESYPDEVAKTKPILGERDGSNDSHQLDSESDKEKSAKESKSRRNREWKGLVRDVAEPPPLRSSEIDNFHSEGQNHHKRGHLKRSRSPRPPLQNKRSHQDERHQMKREVPSHPVIDVPRRLLQSAVRDAVGTVRSSSLRAEPTLKRLRSVVSTSTGDSSLEDKPQRIRSVARLPSAVATAFKAAAAAAEDVTKARFSGNVFDRLGHGMDVSGMTNQSSEFKATHVGESVYEDFDPIPGEVHSDYLQRNEYIGEFAGNMAILDRDTGVAYDDYASDNEGYDDFNAVDHRVMDASQTGTSSVNKDEDSLMVRYSVAKNTNEVVRRTRVKDQNPAADAANTSRKIVNISVNVNTWKPPHYQEPREVREVENVEAVQGSEAVASKPGVRPMKENSNTVVAIEENEKPGSDMQKESQKTLAIIPGSYSIGRPSDDADSRTIFVSNVHFAATKDTLSRHFNKFGEVLKVVIMTDAATGQPKGSAYVEFMRKEAAELALSLNGTSFMSRILKVVRKSLAYQEASNISTWPRVARPSPFGARLARVPFPRGMPPGAFRPRLAIKPGARSLQWKRDAPATPATDSTVNVQNGAPLSNNSVPSPTARSLTYIRK